MFNPIASIRNAFAKRKSATIVVNDSGPRAGGAQLWNEQAVSALVDLLTKIPETDDLLTQANIQRYHLKKLETDDEIFGLLRTRREAVVATPWRLEGGVKATNDFLMEEITPIVEAMVSGAWKAVPYGYSVMEGVYKRRDDRKIGLEGIYVKPMEWFDPRPDGTLRYFSPDGYDAMGVPCDLDFKFFLTRSEPTYFQPKGEALLSRLYWPWFFRFNGWRFWGQFLERFGQPLLIGKSNKVDTMLAALIQVHQDSCISVGREDSVEVVEPDTKGDAFDLLEQAVVRRYQKLILGQTLTSDTGKNGGGSYALGQVHAEVKEGLRKSDIRLVRRTAQAVVNALCALNGVTADIPEIIFADDAGLEAERAKRDETLFKLGVKFKKGYFTDRYDLKEEDFELSEQKLAAINEPDSTEEDGEETNVKPIEEDDAKMHRSLGDQSVDTTTVRASHAGATDHSDSTDRLALLMQRSGFAKRRARDPKRFTPAQQLVDDAADEFLSVCGQPIHSDMVRSVIMAARDPIDLADRLTALMGEGQSSQFITLLERALFAADVIGYANSDGKV
jgi:phage gp29-like protein